MTEQGKEPAFLKPEFRECGSAFVYTWPDLGLEVQLDRMRDNGAGEIIIRNVKPDGTAELVEWRTINLLNFHQVEEFVRVLGKRNNNNIDWQRVLTYAGAATMSRLRDGLVVQNVNQEPERTQTQWVLYPFLPDMEPTTIFGPGGRAKSLLVDMFGLVIISGVSLPGLPYIRAPHPGNVLLLDWERNGELHKQRISAMKKAMDVRCDATFHYIEMDKPLTAAIESLEKHVAEIAPVLIMVDSQMAATGGMTGKKTDADVASEYYNACRHFRRPVLSIDHTSKANVNGDADEGPFGSIVKYNRATSVYRIDSDSPEDSDTIQLRITHKKNNIGRKQRQRGIEIHFENTDEGEAGRLVGISFQEYSLVENETYRAKLPTWQIIKTILEENGGQPMICQEIAEAAAAMGRPDIDAKRAYDVMANRKQTFVKVENSKAWRLVDRNVTP